MMLEQQVKRGIALLDERAPGWRAKIDLAKLDMRHRCVLEQVFGDYFTGLTQIGLGDDPDEYQDFGFTLFTKSDRPFDELTAEWKRQLITGADNV